MVSRREAEMREERRTNAKAWAKDQEKGGGGASVRLPEGFERYKLEPGTHEVDFMPYRVGLHNPAADEGMVHFERQYTIHWVPDSNGKNTPHCCLTACFDRPCPVCKFINEHGRNADKELMDKLRGKVRHLWIVNDKPGSSKGPFKIFESTHKNQGKGFVEVFGDALVPVKDGIDFYDLKNGLKATMIVRKMSADTFNFTGVSRIDFAPRDYSYKKELLDQMPCLDDLLCPTMPAELKEKFAESGVREFTDKDWKLCYHELNKLLNQEAIDEDDSPSRNGDDDENEGAHSRALSRLARDDDDDADEKEVPARKGKGIDIEDEDEQTAADLGIEKGDRVKYRGMICDVVKISGDGISLTLEDEDGDDHTGVAPAEVEKLEEEDEGEEESPKSRAGGARSAGKKGAPARSRSKDEDDDEDENDMEDDDDEEPDEDEEPESRSRKPKKRR